MIERTTWPGARLATPAIALSVIAMLATTMLATPAAAQRDAGLRGIGPRVGIGIDPDQLLLGAHLDLGDVARDVMILPNAMLGFGDDVTLVAGMIEFDYQVPSRAGAWRPYLGAGLGAVYADPDHGSGDWNVGLSWQIGLANQYRSDSRFFLEAKFGGPDLPDVAFMVGWSFALRSARERRQTPATPSGG